jgi:glyoxylase-like metal-dependent hydrolase (beta-lactamase superfamily II)
LRWTVGDVNITRIAELLPLVPVKDLMPDATSEALERHWSWMFPRFIDADHNLKMSIHAFLVESQETKILVDTCVGNDKDRAGELMRNLRTPFLEQLAAAGAGRDDVDVVLCTHLHFDHVGWNTVLEDGTWVPTFQYARYLFPRAEWEHRCTEYDRGASSMLDSRTVMNDSLRPIIDAGLVDFVGMDHHLTKEVRLEPTPGHTPGHVSVRISSRGHEAVITGDLLHNPIQFGEPTWCGHVDNDREQAIATRRAFAARAAADGILVLGTHFPPPTAGRLVPDGDSWRFDPDAASGPLSS